MDSDVIYMGVLTFLFTKYIIYLQNLLIYDGTRCGTALTLLLTATFCS